MQRMIAGVCIGLLGGLVSVATLAEERQSRDLPDFMDCLQVFHEPERQHVRVTTLFCGSDEDGATPDGFEVRQYAVSLIDTMHQTVRYALHTMIRSKHPLQLSAATLDSQPMQRALRSQSSSECTPVEGQCWYETALVLPLDLLDTDRADQAPRLHYQVTGEGRVFTLSLNRREIEAVRLFTEGLLVSLPDAEAQPAGNAI